MTEYCPNCKVLNDKQKVQTIHLSKKDNYMKINEVRYCDIHGIIHWDKD